MRRFILGTSALALSLLLTACGGSDEPTTRPTAEPSSASSTPTADGDPSAEASSGSGSAVPAATGPLISGPGWSLNAPADWTGDVETSSTGGAMLGPDITADFLNLSDLEDTVIDPDLDAMAAQEVRLSTIDPPLTRQPDVTIAGMPAFHFAGEDKGFVRWTETFGFAADDDLVRITIGSPLDTPQAERDATSAAILASVKPTG